MKTCNKKHPTIAHTEGNCPLCFALAQTRHFNERVDYIKMQADKITIAIKDLESIKDFGVVTCKACGEQYIGKHACTAEGGSATRRGN